MEFRGTPVAAQEWCKPRARHPCSPHFRPSLCPWPRRSSPAIAPDRRYKEGRKYGLHGHQPRGLHHTWTSRGVDADSTHSSYVWTRQTRMTGRFATPRPIPPRQWPIVCGFSTRLGAFRTPPGYAGGGSTKDHQWYAAGPHFPRDVRSGARLPCCWP